MTAGVVASRTAVMPPAESRGPKEESNGIKRRVMIKTAGAENQYLLGLVDPTTNVSVPDAFFPQIQGAQINKPKL